MKSTPPVQIEPFVLYQSTQLSAYADRLIHGFTGKPVTLGGSGYDANFVLGNRHLVCEAVGLHPGRLTLPRQTHSDQYRVNDLPCAEESDAVILTEPDISAMVQVADCVPIILYAPDQHVGAVIHAGWRGTAKAITPKIATVLIKEHQVNPGELLAVIGPSIGGCCYEVSLEVAEMVSKTVPNQLPSAYQVIQANGKPLLDLKQVNRLQLEALGIGNIEVINACTRCLEDQLWSFRREEAGRQVAFLQLKAL